MNDLRLLRLAVALDQQRNFGRAAEATGIAQPAFSRGIAALEAALGTRLFDRNNRHVEPTPAGTVLLARARSLLADAAALRDAVADHKGLRSGHLKIGVGPYPLEISVVDCVARLASRHPLLQVEILEGPWRGFGPMLLSGEVELAVMETAIVAEDARFEVSRLPPHQGCFYSRRGHPLAGLASVTIARILEYPLVGVRIPVGKLPRAGAGAHGLLADPVTGDLMPRVTTTSVAASRAIVKRTDGIGFAVPLLIADDVREGHLVVLDVRAATLRTDYGITHLRDRTLSPGANAFVATLKEVEAELAGSAGVTPRGTRARRAPPARPRGEG